MTGLFTGVPTVGRETGARVPCAGAWGCATGVEGLGVPTGVPIVGLDPAGVPTVGLDAAT